MMMRRRARRALRLHDQLIDRQPEMSRRLRLRRTADAEHVHQTPRFPDLAEFSELVTESRMIRQRGNRTGREAETVDFEPDAVKLSPADERVFIARPAEQQNCRCRTGL